MTTLKIPVIPLDPLQRKAAESPEGPSQVLGGPGTGKSHVMIARIVSLIKGGASPHNITYVTFSSRGAEDMKNQLKNLPEEFKESLQHIFVGTLHYYASHFLRRAGAPVLGLSPQFTIWDHKEMKEVMIEITKEQDTEEKLEIATIERIINWYEKNQTQEPENAVPAESDSWLELMKLYTAEKRSQNTLDLNELIPLAITAMQRDQKIREVWASNRSRHLLVDEFQDITPLQYRMINLMTGPSRSIMIAADPNQSIYRWRGADPKLLEQIRMDRRNMQVHLLRINHRCTSTIARLTTEFANHKAMEGLTHDYQKAIRTEGTVPRLITFEGRPSLMDLAIIDHASDLNQEGMPWEDMAFIYRSIATANRMRTSLKNRAVPFTVLGETLREEDDNTRCITNILAFALNPMDMRAFSIAACYNRYSRHRRLPNPVTRQISRRSKEKGINIVQAATEVMSDYQEGQSIRQEIRFAVRSWREINKMLEDSNTELDKICKKAVNLLYKEQGAGPVPLQEHSITRMISLSEMTPRLARENAREHLARFLELLASALYPNHRSMENDDPFAHQKGITLSTIHSSKSLQWKAVWLIDASDQVIPGRSRSDGREAYLESQRLFYVAITRATDHLSFYCSQDPSRKKDSGPSEFFDAIDRHLYRERMRPQD